MKARINFRWIFVVLLLICAIPVISQTASSSMRVHAKKKNGKDVYYKQGQYVRIMSQTGQHYEGKLEIISTNEIVIDIDTFKPEDIKLINGRIGLKVVGLWFAWVSGTVALPVAFELMFNITSKPINIILVGTIITGITLAFPMLYIIPTILSRDKNFIGIE